MFRFLAHMTGGSHLHLPPQYSHDEKIFLLKYSLCYVLAVIAVFSLFVGFDFLWHRNDEGTKS